MIFKRLILGLAVGSLFGQAPTSDSLVDAAAWFDVGQVERILNTANVDVNAVDTTTWHLTALMAASRKGTNPPLMELLISRGADVRVGLADGLTALMLASCEGNNTVFDRQVTGAQLLLSRGARVNAVTSGKTPLKCALDLKNLKLAEILRKAGGKENASEAERVEVKATDLLSTVLPDYPIPAREKNIEGTVRFAATVGKDGKVKSAQLIDGNPLLQLEAFHAVKRCTFKVPATETVTRVDVSFILPRPRTSK